MTRKEYRRLQSLIRKHTQAQIDLSWKGRMHPDDWKQIKDDATEAKKKLYAYMNLLIKE